MTQVLSSYEVRDRRAQLLYTLGYTFATLGYTRLKARGLHGYPATAMILGTMHSHRPDMSACQNDTKKTPFVLDVVLPEDLENLQLLHSRLSLFSDLRKERGYELHLAVQAAAKVNKQWIERRVRELLAGWKITANKIWVVA